MIAGLADAVRSSAIRNRRTSNRSALFAVCLLGANVAAFGFDREKTDVVALRNGDRFTGEIVALEYGILQVKTSDIGTLKIEWPAVKSIATRYTFYVERVGVRRLYGALATDVDGEWLIVGDYEATRIPMSEVTRLSQVEAGFWQRVDGSLALGYNFAKSSDVSISSLSFNAHYRSRDIESSLALSALSTATSEGGASDRDQLSGTIRFLRPSRNFWLMLGSLDRNEELGIDSRAQLGAGVGRPFLQRDDVELTGFAGLSFNQEWSTGADGSRQSLEGVLGAQWRIFRFKDPETALDFSLLAYPSLTKSGRYRGELNVTLSRELIDDLTFDIGLYGSYDNQPPDENVAKSDYGVVTSLGYKF